MDEPSVSPHRVTQLLQQWSHGDDAALAELTPLVYEELRRLAHHYMGGERPDHTLQMTALVNEAYLRLADQTNPNWQSRAHFFAVAARASELDPRNSEVAYHRRLTYLEVKLAEGDPVAAQALLAQVPLEFTLSAGSKFFISDRLREGADLSRPLDSQPPICSCEH
jgi:ECF sigma factor